MSTDKSGTCWRCGRPLDPGDYARGETCPGCRSETRCCRNCGLYDPRLNNECKESQADRVVDKEKSVFCEYFHPRPAAGVPARRFVDPAQGKAKASFDALFKKKK
ncbi:MAG TPA: hypothetical protein DCM05_13040 [Elusimicrobia bacterium]|nr:hypothetical protein [Elusimicrobiota bacterium]